MMRKTTTSEPGREIFHLILIVPARYDEEGYPLQWWRSCMPANSLATLNGLGRDCRDRQVLGPNVDIRITAIDETNHIVKARQLIGMIRRDGGKGLIAMVGVQSNQFPRSLDLAQPFVAAGVPVCIGGFHVSGIMATLKEPTPDMQAAIEQGIGFFLGEAEEGRLDQVLKDAYAGPLQPMYNYLENLPEIAGAPIPILAEEDIRRTIGWISSFDVGRGCPYQCSFCTIINVHGRKSRFRTKEDLEKIIRENNDQGIRQFFVTDDNLARNKNWPELLDGLIELQQRMGIKLELSIQVDTRCHQVPNFIPKAVEAGTKIVFVGLENINPDNLKAAGKAQNRITDYREMLLEWKKYPVAISAGYIVGFPFDTKESLKRDVEIIKRELPVDHIYFTQLTPLPGSADHARLYTSGEWLDPDFNRYNTNYRVTHHPVMSDEDWDEAYLHMWHSYYSWDHMTTILKRAHALGGDILKTRMYVGWYHHFPVNLGIHPVEGGLLRLPARTQRRPGLPRENPLIFYPRYVYREIRDIFTFWRVVRRLRAIDQAIAADPERLEYRDAAITPATETDYENLGLYQTTRGGMDAVAKAAARAAAQAKLRRTHTRPAA
ncbi:B12-binding domain-containing radical SAM protein [Thiococcus pfennigii]|uniref:B12-binding domain-containing radical SAM protein n=1 Tax=Thiococcus pfennigii TaxID=1057 RepID=UPI001908E77D|nr:radical SAM protein [Thiococcus pfennigii]MBK1701186.1 radical SAM protein [Thiococcus pfennigii]MBK1732119.1 radical SAM protein [Thiococcus pfennigii]